MMSYEDGWQTSPYGNAPTDVDYGYMGSLMAFDIAAIQDKYGVNEDWATGNDVYVLKDVNEAGTYYSSIRDGGGIDSIVYGGARDATIDLRAATLQYQEGGGGRVSYAYGIYGGFTIANSVVIENAVSGAGNDKLTGNGTNNILDGGAGVDVLAGRLGNDWFYVDNAADQVLELAGEGNDRVFASVSYTLAAGQSAETMTTEWNTNAAAINLTGNELINDIYGNDGNNVLDGGSGVDYLTGRAGADLFAFTTAPGSGNVDTITDFVHGTDKIALDDAIFAQAGGVGDLNANVFVTGSAAADAADRIIYNSATGQLCYDSDGTGRIEAVQFATVTPDLTLTASDFQVI